MSSHDWYQASRERSRIQRGIYAIDGRYQDHRMFTAVTLPHPVVHRRCHESDAAMANAFSKSWSNPKSLSCPEKARIDTGDMKENT